MADNIKLVTKEYVDTELSTKANRVISNMSYESFIDTYHLKEPEWVDLSFVGGEYYYTDFNTAVTDVNNGNTAGATTNKNGAVCQIFTDGNITVLRLLSDITITTPIIFTKSVIFDINGFTVTLNGVSIGDKATFYDVDLVLYGAKENSKMSGVKTRQIVEVNIKHLYVLNGSYSATGTTKVFTIISSYDETEENYIEVYNVLMNIHSERTSSNPSCIWGYAGNKPINLKVVNSRLTSEAVNTSRAMAIFFIHDLNKTETARIDIFNCNISAKGTDGGDSSSTGIFIQNQKAISKIVNTTIEGITAGLSTHGEMYIKNSKCYSPYHGGVYNAINGTLYAENTEFHRSATPTGYTPTGTGCAYFGYGSTAYLNNCKFIRDVESDTSPGIVVRKEGTPEGETTRVFVSNSEMPGIRCDADQEIYLGNGISDTIKNATVQGTKYLTDNNYVYIEDKGAYSLLNPNAIVANQSELDKKQDLFATVSFEDGSGASNDRMVLTPKKDSGEISEIYFNITHGASDWRAMSKTISAPYFKTYKGYYISGDDQPPVLMSAPGTFTKPIIKFESIAEKYNSILRGVADPEQANDVANKKYVDDSIATQVSSVYKAKGSIADISALPTPDKTHEGFVYNIETAFITTDQFVEGVGKTYPAGTNVVIVNTTGTEYKYDVLAGMVDLSNYATKTDLSGKLDKQTSTGTFIRTYTVNKTGSNEMMNMSTGADASTVAIRTLTGSLRVTTPVDNNDAATKKYVDDAIGNINSILATMFNDVSTQSDEEPTDDEEVIA